MRPSTLERILLVSSLVGCATPGPGKTPENVQQDSPAPSVSERTDEEIDAIWERCRATSNARVAAPGQVPVSGEPGQGARGSLSKEQIRSTIEANIAGVRVCYQQALASDPSLSGKVLAKFVIAGDGSVVQARVVEAPSGLAGTGSCIVDRIRTWIFPAPDNKAIVVVTYPFTLEPLGPLERGSFDHDAAWAVFEAHGNDFRRCYGRALAHQPSAEGVVGISVTVAPSGKVLRAATYQNETKLPELACCMTTVAQSYRFAQHDGEPTEVLYAVKFDPHIP